MQSGKYGQTIRTSWGRREGRRVSDAVCYWIVSPALELGTAWTITPPVLPREARHAGLRIKGANC
jgi:hypothetical protein